MREHSPVYRVQDSEGRGPFRPGFSRFWCDDERHEEMPTWFDEFGADLIYRLGKPNGEQYGTAVRTIDCLNRWFSRKEQVRLKNWGYNVVSFVPDRILAESETQLIFAKNTPLNIGVSVVPFPALDITGGLV